MQNKNSITQCQGESIASCNVGSRIKEGWIKSVKGTHTIASYYERTFAYHFGADQLTPTTQARATVATTVVYRHIQSQSKPNPSRAERVTKDQVNRANQVYQNLDPPGA